MLGLGAQTGGGGSMYGCMSQGRGRALLLHWPWELGGELLGDARPSRDRELQRDAAFRAVVTPFWVPAPRCPAQAGWHRAQEKRSRSSGPSVAAAHSRRESGGGNDCKDRPRKTTREKTSSWQISTTKTKKWSSPCRMERKTALWEGVKATSQQEIIDGDRPADWPLTSDGLYPIGRSMMGWAEMEMIWKCSWRR